MKDRFVSVLSSAEKELETQHWKVGPVQDEVISVREAPLCVRECARRLFLRRNGAYSLLETVTCSSGLCHG